MRGGRFTSRSKLKTDTLGASMVTSEASVDWKKVRQELQARRTEAFDHFLKNPSDIHLAIEIKLLDDELVDCSEHVQREREREHQE